MDIPRDVPSPLAGRRVPDSPTSRLRISKEMSRTAGTGLSCVLYAVFRPSTAGFTPADLAAAPVVSLS